MIDIIIPAYNAHKYICDALNSISCQIFSDNINVYIVNDCSDKDYSEIINKYSKILNIKELKTKKNVGPGAARQFGIDNSTSEYIIFLDSDDVFYNCYSIKNLYSFIDKRNYNAVCSDFIEEINDKRITHYNDTIWMHGKIYRRSFLEKNKIRFNKTRSNEDTGFNKLITLIDRFGYYSEITYVYKNNKDSITRKNNNEYVYSGLEGYYFNICYAVLESERIKLNKNKISLLLYETMLDSYMNYLRYKSKDILVWSKKLEKLFSKYRNYCDEIDRNNLIKEKLFNGIDVIGEYNYLNNDISFNDYIKMIEKI